MAFVRSAGRVLLGVSLPGVLLAALLFWQSLAPSLLARSWVLQGVLAGIGLALGYGVGCVVGRLWGYARRRLGLGLGALEDRRVALRARLVYLAVVLVLTVVVVVDAVGQHRWTWSRLGYQPSGFWYMYGGTLALAAAVFAVLYVLARALGWVRRQLARAGRIFLPRWVAGTLATLVVVLAASLAVNHWLYERTLDGMNAAMAASDVHLGDDAPPPPTSPYRSGGTDSAVDWAEAGHEGRRFLSRGPDAAKISRIAPAAAAEPVRVYVGRASADSVRKRVAIAMAELDRLGAFERAAVLVNVPTGTGWMNEQIFQPVEYLLEGDVAVVGVQYSHLPSPFAYLAERESAAGTGRQLVAAVSERIEQLPAQDRPALFVTGESLGSFGAGEAFEDLDDMTATADHALWVGAPEFAHLRREAEVERTPGSLQISPDLGDDGRILFANRASDLDGRSPQVVFLQQGDDPIVWWDLPTAVRRPDWLAEPLDRSVNPDLRWRPVSTFLNLTVDMAVGNDFDEDHGHLYGTQPLDAWVAMLHPQGWDTARVDRLRAHLQSIQR